MWVLSDERFRELYTLLDHGQTLDDSGAAMDCGVRCEKFCCSGATTKYLLPGEGGFITREMERMGHRPFRVEGQYFFDTITALPGTTPDCICGDARTVRPFNCRAFPYAPSLEGDRVVGLHRNVLGYLAPCWIQRPGFDWARGAIRAWQMVLDDVDCRLLFAKMAVMWEWNQALERGEQPGPVLHALGQIRADDVPSTWQIARRFFHRSDSVLQSNQTST